MSERVVHYRPPGPVTRRLLNPLVQGLTRAGISVWGSRVLEAKGRQSGLIRRTPVNLLYHEGRQYLVSPRGECQWVRNVRSDCGRLTLRLGHQRAEMLAEELTDSEKSPILRAYLRRWKMEVGIFFDGVSADSSEEDVHRIAHDHPVFVLHEAGSEMTTGQSVRARSSGAPEPEGPPEVARSPGVRVLGPTHPTLDADHRRAATT